MRALKQRMRAIAAVKGNTGEGASSSSSSSSAAAAAAAAASTSDAAAGASSSLSSSAESAAVAKAARRAAAKASKSAALTSLFDFVESGDAADAEAEEADTLAAAALAAGTDAAEFSTSGSAEAKALLDKARASRALARLFRGAVFFLQREIPREPFEFIICSFGGEWQRLHCGFWLVEQLRHLLSCSKLTRCPFSIASNVIKSYALPFSICKTQDLFVF